MASYRNIARICAIAASGTAVLIAQLGIGQGLPGMPICQGNPPTPTTNCRVNGQCAENDTCAGKELGAILESSRTWC